MLTHKFTDNGFIPYTDTDFERDYPSLVKSEIGKPPSWLDEQYQAERKLKSRELKLEKGVENAGA
jgi:hypothetical protein